MSNTLSMDGLKEFIGEQGPDRPIDHTMWHTCVFAEYVASVIGEGERFFNAVEHVRNNFRDPFNERVLYPNTLCSIMNHGGDVDAMPLSPPHDHLDEICDKFPHEDNITTYGMLQDLLHMFPHIVQPISRH